MVVLWAVFLSKYWLLLLNCKFWQIHLNCHGQKALTCKCKCKDEVLCSLKRDSPEYLEGRLFKHCSFEQSKDKPSTDFVTKVAFSFKSLCWAFISIVVLLRDSCKLLPKAFVLVYDYYFKPNRKEISVLKKLRRKSRIIVING